LAGLLFLGLAACPAPVESGLVPPDVALDGVGSIHLVLPERIEAQACEKIEFDMQVDGDLADVQLRVEGRPPLSLTRNELVVSFRAPSEAYDTTFMIRAIVTSTQGTTVDELVEVSVKAAPLQEGLSLGMTPGCAPFQHGVASGDPTQKSVILWTRYTPVDQPSEVSLGWKIATDPHFEAVVAEGSVQALKDADYTVHVAVPSLEPHTTYYYQFTDSEGKTSMLGRTRTSPASGVERLRLAVMSCSSIYSGFFNAYRRIAERDDLDVLIHLGDYIYDFVDQDEEVRVPTPYPVEPNDVHQWRARHAYYLMDPDLRLARAMHPWIVIWDNHDVDGTAEVTYEGSVQAFREWVPMRASQTEDDRAYRRLSYGDLLDILILDVLLHRNTEKVPESEEFSILGDAQWDWLEKTLTASKATWRVIGSQKIMGTVRVDPAFRNGSEFFDTKTWDGFPADRKRVFGLLSALNTGNNVVVSGDSHISLALDLVDEPALTDPPYDPKTSQASLGVEILPTSISRGNFNEQVGDLPELFEYLSDEIMGLNPHHRYLELTKHGYGMLDVTAERVIAEIWYSSILEPADEEELGTTLEVLSGAQKWTR
jgi:alkaline phosphatase D